MENEAYQKLNMDYIHQFFTKDESQPILDQCPATTTVQRLQSVFNDAFSRPLAPMLLVSIILQAVQNKLDSPILFPHNQATVDLINIIMKTARFNKASAKSVTTENAHQGCFATNQLLHHYQELLSLITGFNKDSANFQIQLHTSVYALEGIYIATIRLITTKTKIIVDNEKDALFKSLNYLKSKRSGSETGRPNSRGSRGNKRGRK